MTPLHVVGQSGDKEMATFLFENGELFGTSLVAGHSFVRYNSSYEAAPYFSKCFWHEVFQMLSSSLVFLCCLTCPQAITNRGSLRVCGLSVVSLWVSSKIYWRLRSERC